jgi:transposase-like protein
MQPRQRESHRGVRLESVCRLPYVGTIGEDTSSPETVNASLHSAPRGILEIQLSPHLLERWRGEWRAKGDLAFPGVGRRGASQPSVDDARRIAELERKIGQLTMENDFLKKSLAAFQGVSSASWKSRFSRRPRRKTPSFNERPSAFF